LSGDPLVNANGTPGDTPGDSFDCPNHIFGFAG